MSGVDINSIEDEDELHKMLTKTEDFDERKKIRARMKEVREKKAGRDLVGKHQGGSTEETTSTSTKTETGKDGSKTTTTTTTTTKKTQGPQGGAARPNFLAAPGGGGAAPAPAAAGGGLVRSPSAIKQMLLEWTKQQTAGYEHVNITNFSSSWNDGMAFAALIHSFYPKSFDYSKLDPKRRRANFTLAFGVADKVADIAPLLDVDDMVRMKNPDWKCVFTYVQSFYRRFRMQENKNPESPVTPTTPKTPLSPEPTTQ